MATGDPGDMAARIRAVIPSSWFSRSGSEMPSTSPAVSAAVANLTGTAPVIFEPAYTHDTGGYGTPAQGGGDMGYRMTGGWGSLQLPFQFFIEAYRPVGNGIALVAGYISLGSIEGMPGGYGTGAIEYGSLSLVGSQILDSEINAIIAASIPAATIAWTRILDAPVDLPLVDEFGATLSDEAANPLKIG